ncbi:MAG: nickel pincer cofactor biosynthesis protein LarB [Clostridiales bacterium]|jgi:NCAIR mutase (PurE)-related protein|nr:nickel pincer cofactor biosynthesis protein LarB [Clostridiales bacterium]
MDETELKTLLGGVRAGTVSVERAVGALKQLPYVDMGFAKVDHHRELRTGYPEVIFCQGKTAEQVRLIVAELLKEGSNILATRAQPEVYEEVMKAAPDAEYSETARTIVIRRKKIKPTEKIIGVVSAGTSDLPVAEEACITAETLGNTVERLYDVGVAGLHRLLSNTDKLARANVLIVVAGMEGALASVVGGLVDKPVIAVPTSVGYGASFGGLAALLAMLNSCASGVGVVNIDNGFGAGFLASMINKL